jgi:Ser/Thr protein kinase RdoA (MazF antagonist)
MMQAVYAFQIEGNPIEAAVFGHGHINHTIKVKTDAGKDYVLQRINTYVFKDPVHLMENAGAVTKFLAERVDDPRAALHFIPAKDGKYYHVDEAGSFWRMYDFVGGFCLDAAESEEDFYQSAIAFGRFQNLLSDFPAETLYETIPEFHNTIDRYRLFHASIDADVMGRAADVQPEIDFLLEREEEMGLLQRMREAGEIPLRVTHNDTKLNNVLLDKNTRKCLCVLDLDTVMPGLSVYDFGDSIRFGAATAAEDEFDLSKMSLDLRLFEVYTMGFLEACPSLTETEVKMLAVGAKTMTLECAMRFLTDYLDGDKYFGVQYPQHNLVRARSQLKLVKDMEKKWDKMNEIVAQVAKQTRRG